MCYKKPCFKNTPYTSERMAEERKITLNRAKRGIFSALATPCLTKESDNHPRETRRKHFAFMHPYVAEEGEIAFTRASSGKMTIQHPCVVEKRKVTTNSARRGENI